MLTTLVTAMLVQAIAASPGGTQRSADPLAALNATGVGVLSLPRDTIHLEPITVHELVGDTRQPSPEATVTGHYQNGAFVAQGALAPAPLPAVIRRPLHGLWRLDNPAGAPGSQRVRVALEGVDGSPGVLSSVDDPRQQLPVAVTETVARQVSLGPQKQATEGDVVLEIPTAALGSATRYRGRLVIRVEGY
ncbi:MAG TPA: hypothetical protein VJ724_00825 [Tahibacter sp.]|nr:hypothetical protein [Tahibacter sp.]